MNQGINGNPQQMNTLLTQFFNDPTAQNLDQRRKDLQYLAQKTKADPSSGDTFKIEADINGDGQNEIFSLNKNKLGIYAQRNLTVQAKKDGVGSVNLGLQQAVGNIDENGLTQVPLLITNNPYGKINEENSFSGLVPANTNINEINTNSPPSEQHIMVTPEGRIPDEVLSDPSILKLPPEFQTLNPESAIPAQSPTNGTQTQVGEQPTNQIPNNGTVTPPAIPPQNTNQPPITNQPQVTEEQTQNTGDPRLGQAGVNALALRVKTVPPSTFSTSTNALAYLNGLAPKELQKALQRMPYDDIVSALSDPTLSNTIRRFSSKELRALLSSEAFMNALRLETTMASGSPLYIKEFIKTLAPNRMAGVLKSMKPQELVNFVEGFGTWEMAETIEKINQLPMDGPSLAKGIINKLNDKAPTWAKAVLNSLPDQVGNPSGDKLFKILDSTATSADDLLGKLGFAGKLPTPLKTAYTALKNLVLGLMGGAKSVGKGALAVLGKILAPMAKLLRSLTKYIPLIGPMIDFVTGVAIDKESFQKSLAGTVGSVGGAWAVGGMAMGLMAFGPIGVIAGLALLIFGAFAGGWSADRLFEKFFESKEVQNLEQEIGVEPNQEQIA